MRERETLSRNNGRHSVSGKAKKEGRGLAEGMVSLLKFGIAFPTQINHSETEVVRALSDLDGELCSLVNELK